MTAGSENINEGVIQGMHELKEGLGVERPEWTRFIDADNVATTTLLGGTVLGQTTENDQIGQ